MERLLLQLLQIKQKGLTEIDSVVPGALAPLSHICGNGSVGGRSDGAKFMRPGSSIDQFYYSNTIPAGFVSDAGQLAGKFVNEFFERDDDGVLYRRKTSLSTVGVPNLLLEGDYDEMHINNGTEGDCILSGNPLPDDDLSNIL